MAIADATTATLVLLSLLLLRAATADSPEPAECTAVTYGSKTIHAVPIWPLWMPLGADDFVVGFPLTAACGSGKTRGIMVRACSEDVPPKVRIMSMSQVLVKRAGYTTATTSVAGTVYCAEHVALHEVVKGDSPRPYIVPAPLLPL